MLPYSDSLLCAASTSYSSAEAGTGFVRRARTSRDVEAALASDGPGASGGGLAAASLDTRRTAGRGAEKVRFTVVAADGLALAPAVLFMRRCADVAVATIPATATSAQVVNVGISQPARIATTSASGSRDASARSTGSVRAAPTEYDVEAAQKSEYKYKI